MARTPKLRANAAALVTRVAAGLQTRRFLCAKRDAVRDRLWERIRARYEDKEARVGPEMMRRYEQWIVLQVIDGHEPQPRDRLPGVVARQRGDGVLHELGGIELTWPGLAHIAHIASRRCAGPTTSLC